jgi:pimeloyl-ACP methyl ester carboxylesterase
VQFVVDGHEVYAGTGGRKFDPSLPVVVFLHGAGFDHTAWVLLARWFSHHGCAVLAPDLPGHGRSAGDPLRSIGAMADWTAALMTAAGAGKATLIGHSLGALVALEVAARHSEKVTALGLVATAAVIPVSSDLLGAAEAKHRAAVDMVSHWGHGFRAGLGGSRTPGIWMRGGAERVLERDADRVLFTDLAACNEYGDGLASAARVRVPAVVVLGERDLMTPAKGGKQLAAALANARCVVLKGAGHMLMSERPDEVLLALRSLAPN